MPDLTYVSWGVLIVLVALIDRFAWRRGRVIIKGVQEQGSYEGMYFFSLKFLVLSRLMHSQIEYELRSKADPTIVIVGKTRTAAFSKIGDNHESLLFDRDKVKSGEWHLCIKVTSQGSRINPFYVYFPTISMITKEVKL